MIDILKTFPTDAIPGRWRWMSEGAEWAVGIFAREVITATITSGGGALSRTVADHVVFLDDGGQAYTPAPWAAFDPDSDHFERIDAPAEAPKVDPIEAVERVAGWKWEVSAGNGWADLPGFKDGLSGGEVAPDGEQISWSPGSGWYMQPDMVGPETGEAGRAAASLALLRAIDAGRVTLHDGAPGMGALSAADRAALGVS